MVSMVTCDATPSTGALTASLLEQGQKQGNTLVQPELSSHLKVLAVLIFDIHPKFLFWAHVPGLVLSVQNLRVLPHHLSPWTSSLVLYISI